MVGRGWQIALENTHCSCGHGVGIVHLSLSGKVGDQHAGHVGSAALIREHAAFLWVLRC